MNSKVFIPRELKCENIKSHTEKWRSPSNIAIVKYWGKYGQQYPTNPSLSFTLNNSYTETSIKYIKKEQANSEIELDLKFEGKTNDKFKARVEKYLEQIKVYCPFVTTYKLEIETSNSFPHSSGIASSASAFSAIACCLVGFEEKINPEINERIISRKKSFLARLGSGSASRSIEGPIMIWGEHEDYRMSAKEVAMVPDLKLAPVFETFQDSILIVDEGEKEVSSSLGHSLMDDHFFAKRRFEQANIHIGELRKILISGDVKKFGELLENEALTLHAMMMTSNPSFILMKANTIKVINKVKKFRNNTGANVYFTLDAGANVHLLYPKSETKQIVAFIESELMELCANQRVIFDEVGMGAVEVN